MLKCRANVDEEKIMGRVQLIKPLFILATALTVAGCNAVFESKGRYTAEELEQQNERLLTREGALARREAELGEAERAAQQAGESAAAPPFVNDLLPPNATAGECYARVWVEPTYRSRTERILVKEESTRIEITPAVYETTTEQVLVSEGATRLETVAATYKTVTDRKLVSPAARNWLVSLVEGAVPAGPEVLKAVSDHGIDLASASPGMCFHEHFIPARRRENTQRVLVKDSYDVIEAEEAKYRWGEKRVLVSEASKRIEVIPAQYETTTEQVIDVPAHQIWKKGTGPIQRIDEATGEIMCLVDVPATYKTIVRRMLSSPETTREIDIPARYETVRVKELVSDGSQTTRTIPAEYRDIVVREKSAEAELAWHEIDDVSLSAATRTGRKICLVEEPAGYETIMRTAVDTPATSRETRIPPEFKPVEVQKLVTQARKRVIKVPSEYETVNLREIDGEGFMEWRSILCETNMDVATIQSIQQSLEDKGFDPGAIDGVVGEQTTRAVKAFQSANDLPTDEYLNMETVRALGLTI